MRMAAVDGLAMAEASVPVEGVTWEDQVTVTCLDRMGITMDTRVVVVVVSNEMIGRTRRRIGVEG